MSFLREMRTVSVRVDWHHDGMRNPTATEVLVHDRQLRLEDAARRYRQAQQLPVTQRAPLRAGAGWMLVRAGLRLAHADPVGAAPRLARS